MLTRKAVIAILFIGLSGSALAGFSMVQFANNIAGPGGFLLDDSSAFLLSDSAGKLYAR